MTKLYITSDMLRAVIADRRDRESELNLSTGLGRTLVHSICCTFIFPTITFNSEMNRCDILYVTTAMLHGESGHIYLYIGQVIPNMKHTLQVINPTDTLEFPQQHYSSVPHLCHIVL